MDAWCLEDRAGYAVTILIPPRGKLITCGLTSFRPCLMFCGLCVSWGDANSHLGGTVSVQDCQGRMLSWEGEEGAVGSHQTQWLSCMWHRLWLKGWRPQGLSAPPMGGRLGALRAIPPPAARTPDGLPDTEGPWRGKTRSLGEESR